MTQERLRGLTLAICVYNGARRLPEAMASIECQQGAESIPWELLIVDNGSTDDTVNVARSQWGTVLSQRLQIIHEPRVGVGYARLKALAEARYDCLSFVDDDNLISANWIATIRRIFDEDSQNGLIHTPSTARLEKSPPATFDIFKQWLAVGSLCTEEGLVTLRPISFWTAGLSIRLAAVSFVSDAEFSLTLVGRTGNQTLGGEDHEICLCASLAGWGAYYTKNASFVHVIPSRRLDFNYIAQLVENGGKTRRILDTYRQQFDSTNSGCYQTSLASYAREYIARAIALYLKKLFISDLNALLPNELSCNFSKGKLKGYFVRRNVMEQVRKNIEIARRYKASSSL